MKQIKKIFSIALTVIVLLNMVPAESLAAGKVKLNKAAATVYIGKTAALKVTGSSKKVRWISSDRKVASVSSKGKVTGKKAGKAVITAKVSGKKYTCKVTVKKPCLNAAQKTVTIGKSFTLVMKGSSVAKWISSDKSIASVSSKGKVKTKKAGTVVIICICNNRKQYSCVVTVQDKTNSQSADKRENNKNNNSSKTNTPIAENGHRHVYKKVRTIKEASDTEFGEIEYICKVDGCGKTTTMSYGKATPFYWRELEGGDITKTDTRYGYWDTKSAQDILEGINEYRKEKGLSELQYLDKYTSYMQEQVMSTCFGVSDFRLTPADKTIRYIASDNATDCHDKSYFKTKPGLLLPGNDGKNNADLFEQEDIEVGVGCFKSIYYFGIGTSGSQQYYSEEYWQPATRYSVAICIFKNI